MSGELINNLNAVEKKDMFNKGIGDFTSKSIKELMDVNDDGTVDAVEQDRMVSVGMTNTLESINPVVARAFQDETFRLQNGTFLTQKQRIMRERVILAIQKGMLMEQMKDIPEERMDPEELDIEEEEGLDVNNLQEDLEKRQYLSQAEIDNGV
jgi:hypothetical protein